MRNPYGEKDCDACDGFFAGNEEETASEPLFQRFKRLYGVADEAAVGSPAINRVIKTDIKAAIKFDIEAERVIEATFRGATNMRRPLPPVDYAEPGAVTPVSPEFPPCPKCGATRYWISRGKVMCGSRRCYSAVRFILTKIEYHPAH